MTKANAYTLAVELLKTYPTSAKVTASLDSKRPADGHAQRACESQVCLSASNDPEVCVALTMKAMEQQLFDRAQAFAHRGIAAKPEWIGPHLLLGQACLMGELSKADRGYWVGRPRVDRSKIEEGIVAFDRAIQLGNDQNIAHETVDPLLGRAVSKALLDDEREPIKISTSGAPCSGSSWGDLPLCDAPT